MLGASLTLVAGWTSEIVALFHPELADASGKNGGVSHCEKKKCPTHKCSQLCLSCLMQMGSATGAMGSHIRDFWQGSPSVLPSTVPGTFGDFREAPHGNSFAVLMCMAAVQEPHVFAVFYSRELLDMESESGQAEHSARLRLRLIWDNEWHRDVRVARELASRIGPQVEGAPISLAVRRQRWSPRMSHHVGRGGSGSRHRRMTLIWHFKWIFMEAVWMRTVPCTFIGQR